MIGVPWVIVYLLAFVKMARLKTLRREKARLDQVPFVISIIVPCLYKEVGLKKAKGELPGDSQFSSSPGSHI